MFYAHFVLSKKGPLARIWLAAHWDKKLTKAHVFETNIEGSVEAIIQPKMKLALRTSGHLLLGVVRIYSRKAKYLLADCNEAFVKIKMAFRPGAVDLPEENREAAMAAITLPEDFHEFDTSMADLSDIDVHAQFAVNQSRPEEITMREDLGNITLAGDDGFGEAAPDFLNAWIPNTKRNTRTEEYTGDMGFDGGAGMIQDANLDDTLYKNADAAFFLGDSGTYQEDDNNLSNKPSGGGFEGVQSAHHDDSFESEPNDYDEPAGVDDDGDSNGGSFSRGVGNELFGENFAGDAGLFEEPPVLVHVPVESAVQLDSISVQNSASKMGVVSPVAQRFALCDVTQQQQNMSDQVAMPLGSFDRTTLLTDETEAFALEPIDITSVGTEKKVRKKRRLIIDEQKSIASETMKVQLSDTSEIVTTLDLAPPTKKLMHWKETGGVEKLFAFPGRQIVSRRLAKLFSSNLVTRSACSESENTAIESEHVSPEHVPCVDVSDQPDVNDMPELPLATQEAYGMPGSVAPCIVDELALSVDNANHSSRLSLLSNQNSSMVSTVQTPSSPVFSQTHFSPKHHSPVGLTPALEPYEGAADSDDDNNDNDDGCDSNNDVSELDQDDDTTLEPVDDSDVMEAGQEAEAEERRWNKRSQQMMVALNRCLHRHDSVSFRQMAPPSAAHSRKQAAAKFYTFLVLKKMEAIDVSQGVPYGDILISRGSKFELLC